MQLADPPDVSVKVKHSQSKVLSVQELEGAFGHEKPAHEEERVDRDRKGGDGGLANEISSTIELKRMMTRRFFGKGWNACLS